MKYRVHRQLLRNYSIPENRGRPYYETIFDQVSSIAFHRRRGVLLVAEGSPSDNVSIRGMVPTQLPEEARLDNRPRLRLGQRECWYAEFLFV
jgi:hypothetical protein